MELSEPVSASKQYRDENNLIQEENFNSNQNCKANFEQEKIQNSIKDSYPNYNTNITQNLIKNRSITNQIEIEEENDENDFTVGKMIELSESKKFPKKTFIFGSIKKQYSPILNFFDCQTKFDQKPQKSIEF